MTEVVSLLVSTKVFSVDDKDNSYFDFKIEMNMLKVDFYDVHYFEDGRVEKTLKISQEFNLADFFEPYKSFEVYFSGAFTKLSEPYNKPITRDGSYIYKDYYRLESTENPAFIIYFHKTVEQYLVVCNSKPVNKDCVDIEYRSKRTSEIISEIFPEYSSYLKIRDARRKMLISIDPNDSLAALEAQLDILTGIVLTFMGNFPNEFSKMKKEEISLEKFLATYNETSVLEVKTVEKCIEEMAKQKMLIRNSQKIYYREKE
ncbi:MAG: hypothetical protein PHAS_01419 [Phascolarctobacterium sp.]